jgi:DNA-binding MarR family transcriptional regulator
LSSKRAKKHALKAALAELVMRDLSEQMAHYHGTLAAQLGLSAADHKAFDLVCATGSLTAGELAAHTQLTTGAVTGLVDRLERAGFVRRLPDPHDRRKVIIQPNPDVPLLTPTASALGHALHGLASRYSTTELAVLQDFAQRLVAVLRAETERLEKTVGSAPHSSARAPR